MKEGQEASGLTAEQVSAYLKETYQSTASGLADEVKAEVILWLRAEGERLAQTGTPATESAQP